MALILGCDRGHVDHTPYLTFAMVIPHQHAQQFADVSRIALGPTLATVDCDRGRIHHMGGDALGLQKAMQPEALASRFVTTSPWRGIREAKARFGVGDFVAQALSDHGPESIRSRGF